LNSGPIELKNCILRDEIFTQGRDVFIVSGRSVEKFEHAMLINPGDTNWQVNYISIHNCSHMQDGTCMWGNGMSFVIKDIVGEERVLTAPVRRNSNKLLIGGFTDKNF
jgi:hypothetical protein